MDYITMKNGETVSKLGMGLMRLPVTNGKIDYKHGEKMIDKLMESGCNYYDTAYFYHDGESEVFAAKALVARHPRDKFKLATKMPLGDVEKLGGPKATFEGQLNKTGAGYFDFYLLHGIDLGGYNMAKRLGADTYLSEMKKEGKIKQLGFSFHGATDDLGKVLDMQDWDFVQVQLNYYDWYACDGKKIFKAVTSRCVPFIVMEPVRGGGLSNCHADIGNVFKQAAKDKSIASWALRWVGSMPGVDIVLSGMSNLEQVEENIELFSPLAPITDSETAVIEKAMDVFRSLDLTGCTACRYCAKCPQNISIHDLLCGYDDIVRFGSSWTLQMYRQFQKDHLADKCTKCGICEDICPQGLKIIDRIKEIYEKYT